MIKYHSLERYAEIAHFCTEREGGISVGNYASMNLGYSSGDNPDCVDRNRSMLCAELGVDISNLLIPFQTHGDRVCVIDESFMKLAPEQRSECLTGIDALVCALPGVCIGVTTADCVPLLFYDPVQKVSAVVHAGWRGTCARIASKTIGVMTSVFRSDPANVLAAIGPSVSPEIYQVGEELPGYFAHNNFDTSNIFRRENENLFLDLWEANKQDLLEAGLQLYHIEMAGICTYSNPQRFFSARRQGLKSGRMLSGILIQKR